MRPVLCLLTALISLAPLAAEARIRVGNCDSDKSYTVHFESNGQTFDKTLEPGEHYLTFVHPLYINMEDGERIRTRELSEYCIWSGKLRLQRLRDSQWRN